MHTHTYTYIHTYTSLCTLSVTCAHVSGPSHRLESLDALVASGGIGLVVLDSMASLLRKEFDTRQQQGRADRSALLSRQASMLK